MSLRPDQAAELAVERLGGSGFAVAAERASVNVRWAGSSMTTNGSTRQTDLTVVAFHESAGGTSVGTVSTEGVLDAAAVEDLVKRAEAAARDAGPAEDAMPLITPSEAGESPAVWSAPGPEVSLDGVGAFAVRLGQLFGELKSADYALYGFAHQELSSTWLASSTGLRLRHDQPSGTAAATGRTRDASASTWAGRQAPQLAEVDVAGIGAELATKLGWSRRKVEVGVGRQEVILSPSAVSDLLVAMHWEMSGRNAAEGRSAFSATDAGTRLGDQLAPPGLMMVSDPHDPAMPNRPFVVATSSDANQSVFDTGLPVERTSWIDDGRLAHLIETRWTASSSGRELGSPAGNLTVDAGGTSSLDEMIAATERALLLNTLWYIREVDPVTMLLTGLTRDGVYVIEDGQVVGAASNFRWNDSPVAILGRIIEAGQSVLGLPREWGDYWEQVRMPYLRVADFNLSSTSAAV